MLPALYDDQRRWLARISSMLILSAAAILPLTAQTSPVASADEPGRRAVTVAPALPGPIPYPGFTLRRDPFRPAALGAPSFTAVPAGAMASGQAAAIGVMLPPNAGAAQDASSNGGQTAPGAAVVRAIIVGERTRALVEFGDAVRVLAAGDMVGDLKVTEITSAGVTLSDGTLWRLIGAK